MRYEFVVFYSQTGKKLLHVTLIRHHMRDLKFENGLVESRLHDDTWFWDFYASDDWSLQSGSANAHALWTNSFGLDVIKCTERNDKTVTFLSTASRRNKSYTLIFATENDAKIFTGEVDPVTGLSKPVNCCTLS